MSHDELKAKYTKFTEPGGPLHGLMTVEKVTTVNHKPHPFMIGPKHVEYAADKCSGRLGEEALRAHGCYHQDHRSGPKCGLSCDQHTYETAVFVKLLRNLTNKEAHAGLLAIKPDMAQDGIAGIGFLPTPENYTILPPTPEQLAETPAATAAQPTE